MNIFKGGVCVALILISLLFIGAHFAFASDTPQLSNNHGQISAQDTIIVKLHKFAQVQDLTKEGITLVPVFTNGFKNKRLAIKLGLDRYYFASGEDKDVNALKSSEFIESIEEYQEGNFAKAFYVPYDSNFSLQYGHRNVGQPILGQPGVTGADIKTLNALTIFRPRKKVHVAIIDSGVYVDHPDLINNLEKGWNFILNNSNVIDVLGHGTHVAGIVGASANSIGGIGVNPYARIVPLKIGYTSPNLTAVVLALVYAADHDYEIATMSFGFLQDSLLLHDAIRYAFDSGMVLSASMGNDYNDTIRYPAAYPEVIAVGATNNNDIRINMSSYGNHISVSAPGENVFSTYYQSLHPGILYGFLTGTSMAAPHVAGVASLLKSMRPELTNKEIRSIIEQTADDKGALGWDPYYGYGRINAYKALQRIF